MRRREGRTGRLLVDVRAASGHSYRSGTVVELVRTGSGVDAWAGSEWIPLRWWEFTELDDSDGVAVEEHRIGA